uniref:P2Y purinoceptor 14-like n=1 Tax=Maylandia zebra TaxID=106582 RepID=A0A3P9DF31_9CICH
MCCTTSLLAFSSSRGDRLCFNRRLTRVGLSRPGNMAASTFDPSGNNNSNSSCYEDIQDTSAHIFFMVIYTLVFLVGLFLNGFTLNVYFFRGQRHVSSVTLFLKNLAAADFLISLCLPLRIMKYANIKSEIIRKVYCNFGASAFYLNMYASIMFMGFIAANRWERNQDTPGMHSKELNVLYKIIHVFSATIFVTVLVCLVFFYYKTSRKLSVAQEKQPASIGSKKLARSRRNMLVLVSVFCVCFVPYHLVRLPYAYTSKTSNCSWSQVFFYVKEMAVFVSVLNVCLDPLIYFIFCKAFRARLSLKNALATPEVSTVAANADRRSSDTQSSIKRKLSLTPTTRTSVL